MDEYFSKKFVESERILYTPSSFARKSLLHLQEIGSLKALKKHVSRRESLDSYLFFIVESGSGTLKFSGRTSFLESGVIEPAIISMIRNLQSLSMFSDK